MVPVVKARCRADVGDTWRGRPGFKVCCCSYGSVMLHKLICVMADKLLLDWNSCRCSNWCQAWPGACFHLPSNKFDMTAIRCQNIVLVWILKKVHMLSWMCTLSCFVFITCSVKAIHFPSGLLDSLTLFCLHTAQRQAVSAPWFFVLVHLPQN